jgi:hypothetical protein
MPHIMYLAPCKITPALSTKKEKSTTPPQSSGVCCSVRYGFYVGLIPDKSIILLFI